MNPIQNVHLMHTVNGIEVTDPQIPTAGIVGILQHSAYIKYTAATGSHSQVAPYLLLTVKWVDLAVSRLSYLGKPIHSFSKKYSLLYIGFPHSLLWTRNTCHIMLKFLLSRVYLLGDFVIKT